MDSITYLEYRVNEASLLALEEWPFCHGMLEWHICFTGLNHCVFSTVLISALPDGWRKLTSFYFFLALKIIFFSPSKRNVMTSTCPALPPAHSWREICSLKTQPGAVWYDCLCPSAIEGTIITDESEHFLLVCLHLPSSYKLFKTETLLHLSNRSKRQNEENKLYNLLSYRMETPLVKNN